MRRKVSIFLLFALILVSCSDAGRTRVTRMFPDTEVPTVYTEERDILRYLGTNWWNGFFSGEGKYLCDSTHILGVPEEEIVMKLNQYFDILSEISLYDIEASGAMMTGLFNKVEAYQMADSLSNVFGTFGKMMDTYLYDPNSPVRNESLYHYWAEAMASSSLTADSLRLSYEYDARSSALNMTGTMAKDISGLYRSKALYKVLAFVNYGCHACTEMKETLGSDLVQSWVKEGKLEIIDVYADDIPDSLYNVRAIPSLYLVGPDNRVVFKDVPETRIVDYLRRIL